MPNGSQGLDCHRCSHFEDHDEVQEGLCKRFGKVIREPYHSVCRDWLYGEEDIDKRVQGRLSKLEQGKLYAVEPEAKCMKLLT